jgi:hypothetical protein
MPQTESDLEQRFRHLADPTKLDQLLPGNFKQATFAMPYARFSDRGRRTPRTLTAGVAHAERFVVEKGYEGERAEAARLFVLFKVWIKKSRS